MKAIKTSTYLPYLSFLSLLLWSASILAQATQAPAGPASSSEEDHQRSLNMLGIESLRPGVDGNRAGESGGVNYTESLANPYPELPDPLLTSNGSQVSDAETWWQQRRPEILQLFDREVYGITPENLPAVTWQTVSADEVSINGINAIKKHLQGRVDNTAYPSLNITIKAVQVMPAAVSAPVPVMIQLITEPFLTIYQERALEPESWQSLLLKKDWGYTYLDTSTIQADNGTGLTSGIIGLSNHGEPRMMDQWGVLKAWGWGASKLLDYFETDPGVDASRVGIEGHSRWGKAALVTMAYDSRFAIAYISSSGAGGAKLHRRNWGEVVENVAAVSEYHWMAGNFMKYAGPLDWDDLPVDAHQLIALCAPRPVFIGAGNEGDLWVDARGMYMAAQHAGPVYELLGAHGLERDTMPAIEETLLQGDIAFRQHNEGHTDRPNWPWFIEFAEKYLD